MLTSVRHIAFLYTLSNRDKMPSAKCEMKLEMDVTSCQFMEDNFESQNSAFPPAISVACN